MILKIFWLLTEITLNEDNMLNYVKPFTKLKKYLTRRQSISARQLAAF